MKSLNGLKIKAANTALLILAWIPVVITLTVLLFLLGASFMDSSEASSLWTDGISAFHILPRLFSIQSWKQILYNTPEYLLHFWNSVWIALPTVAGSVAISVLMGYGLAFLRFRGKKILLLGLILLPVKSNALLYLLFFGLYPMIKSLIERLRQLPLELLLKLAFLTLTPNFLVLDWLGLLNSRLATILPGMFHPLGMVAMAYIMLAVPQETLEAAQVDGAGQLRCFFYIALPQVKGGIAILTLYNFLDAWNVVEPIVALLQDTALYPLSVALSSFSAAQPGISAACSVLFVIPALLLFGMTREQLIDGLHIRKKES